MISFSTMTSLRWGRRWSLLYFLASAIILTGTFCRVDWYFLAPTDYDCIRFRCRGNWYRHIYCCTIILSFQCNLLGSWCRCGDWSDPVRLYEYLTLPLTLLLLSIILCPRGSSIGLRRDPLIRFDIFDCENETRARGISLA